LSRSTCSARRSGSAAISCSRCRSCHARSGRAIPRSSGSSIVLVKLAQLAATIALAVHARLRVVPRLDATTLRFLAYHVVAVTLLGVALLVVGVAIRTGAVLW
jgi:hypothetical protein